MMKKRSLFFLLLIITMPMYWNCEKSPTETDTDSNTSTMTDIDGNTYKTVKIGEQWWMAENLNVTHYRNGAPIPLVNDNTDWSNLTTGAYCNYENNEEYASVYGKLYNWFAVTDSHGLAPEGWHIPSDTELTELINYLGGDDVAGDKLKEAGTAHWSGSNEKATNESKFTALPGGFRDPTGGFYLLGSNAAFWSSTEYDDINAWSRWIKLYGSGIKSYQDFKVCGLSVRCVKD